MPIAFNRSLKDLRELALRVGEDVPHLLVRWIPLELDFGQLDLFGACPHTRPLGVLFFL